MDTGWLVALLLLAFDVFLALYANPLRNRKMIARLWNEPVELEGLDGEPIKVKVPILDADGEQKFNAKKEPMFKEVTPPLWLGITIGIAGHLKNSFYGTVGKRKQVMERAMLEGMTPDQAAWATAIDQASKGRIGNAFLSLLMPKAVEWVQGAMQRGQQGATTGGDMTIQPGRPRGGRGPI